LLILPNFSIAQQYRSTTISLADGLTQSSVYSIVQDQQGFTWMATQDGLNKYDGISFSSYREEPFDSQSVSSGNISTLFCDSKNRLWVGTATGGLNRFVRSGGHFEHYAMGAENESGAGRIINSIAEDQNGNIWVGTANGLYCMQHDSGFMMVPLQADATDTVPDKFVSSLFIDKQGNLWIGTFQGLFTVPVAANKNNYSKPTFFIPNNQSFTDPVVAAVAQDMTGRLWVGSRKGIDIVDHNGKIVERLQVNESNQNGPRSNFISGLLLASHGTMWVSYRDSGIQSAGVEAGGAVVFHDINTMNESPLLAQGMTLSLYEDRITPGMIWVGFNAGGIVKLAPVTKKFKTDLLQKPGIQSPFVTSLTKDADGVIWIGTTSGLIRKDKSGKSYDIIYPSKFSKTKGVENYIGGVVCLPSGDIIFSSGSVTMRIKHGSLIPEPLTSAIPEPAYIRSLYLAGDGSLFAILRYGVQKYNPQSGQFVPYISINDPFRLRDRGFYVSCMLRDNLGNTWLGTSNGLDFYVAGKPFVTPERTFYHKRSDTTSLRNHTILSIYQDRSGRIWAGTMNGLSRLFHDNKSMRFLNYSTHNGLTNNVVYAIVEDTRNEKLWLSTNNGLTLFDPKGHATANFDVNDGIQSNEFNSYASFISSDGEIFFGGIDGYTSFYPAEISVDTTAPKVALMGLTLGNGKYISLDEAHTIDLKYKDNSFSVSFVGLHYVDPSKNSYAYKLEGFQDNWIPVAGSPRVNFSQLPPGKYTFRIRAANSDGYYGNAESALVINLLPPFYKTIWFFLLIAVFISSVLWGLHKYRLSMKLEQIREIEKLRKATAADFHDELGHKLTIISWFAEILKKKMGSDQQELRPHLDKIIETSGNLYHTMKDMLWAMDPDKDSVYELYNQIRDFGQGLFDETGVLFESDDISDVLQDKMVSPAQRRHVLLIFKEVMHNALKHSGGSDVKLSLKAEEKRILFSFRDNGTGFRMNGQNVGHGLNNVKRRAQMIDAEISIQSEGDGTIAQLVLPLAG